MKKSLDAKTHGLIQLANRFVKIRICGSAQKKIFFSPVKKILGKNDDMRYSLICVKIFFSLLGINE